MHQLLSLADTLPVRAGRGGLEELPGVQGEEGDK